MILIPLSIFDWAILIIYFGFIAWIGFYLKRFTKTDDVFFLAGRRNSIWVYSIAFMSANMDSMEVIGYAGQCIKFGLYVAPFYFIGVENPPRSKYISGSQDHIGLFNPGLSRLFYKGDYWPEHINSTIEKETCNWLSTVLHLIPVNQRPDGFDPIKEKNLIKNEMKTNIFPNYYGAFRPAMAAVI
jgi:hypothetical protein